MSERDTTDGTIGFNPNLAGHAKADRSHTSGFGPQLSGKRPVKPVPVLEKADKKILVPEA